MRYTDWRVLIVEDERDSMELVRDIFDHYGIACMGVTSAEDALMVLEEEKPNLIVTDLALPGMDGWEFVRRLMVDDVFKQVPRVMITAYHSAEVASQASLHGFDGYFPKPLNPEAFVKGLESLLEAG